jgi:AcrR family transcriptional regulator
MADEAAASELSPLRDQAVSRSLDGARVRAEQRVQRFLDAATELILEKRGLDFTVQDVVERSTQSLRSFYQFFDGKQHLLLAVYEDAIRAAGEELGRILDDIDNPLERLHVAIVTIYDWSAQEVAAGSPSPHLTVRAMAAFVFDLMTTDRDAVEVPEVRASAAFLMQTTMFNGFGAAATGQDGERLERAEALWQQLLHGLAAR